MARIIKKSSRLNSEYKNAIDKYEAINQQNKRVKEIAGIATFSIIAFELVIAIISAYFGANDILVISLVLSLIAIIIFGVYYCIRYDDSISLDEIEIMQAGLQGEIIAERILSRLPDSYCVIRNFKAIPNGDIDNIVVGDNGVFIVEVKAIKGVLYGDCSERELCREKNGYEDTIGNPIKQTNSQIYKLKKILRQSNINTYIKGMVYFSSEELSLELTNIPDDFMLFTFDEDDSLLQYIQNERGYLSSSNKAKIINLLSN